MSASAEEELLDKLAECLMADRSQVTLETKAIDLSAWDSMGLVEIVFMLQREYDVAVSPEQAEDLTSVAAIAEVLRSAGKLS